MHPSTPAKKNAGKPPLEKGDITKALMKGEPLPFEEWKALADGTRRFIKTAILERCGNKEIGKRRHLYCEVLRLGVRDLIYHINTESSITLAELWFDYLLTEVGPNGSLHIGVCKCGNEKREKILKGLLIIAEMRESRQAIARVKRALGHEDKVGKTCFTPHTS